MANWTQNAPSTTGFTVNAPAGGGTGTSGTQGNWGDLTYTWDGSNVTNFSAFTWANVVESFGAIWTTGVTIGKSIFQGN